MRQDMDECPKVSSYAAAESRKVTITAVGIKLDQKALHMDEFFAKDKIMNTIESIF